jgi:hypothetical protein
MVHATLHNQDSDRVTVPSVMVFYTVYNFFSVPEKFKLYSILNRLI